MMYEEATYLKDFYKRSKSNLEIIELEHQKGNEKAYEVTQLINSLFALLIYPQQKYNALLDTIKDNEVPKYKKYKSTRKDLKSMNYKLFTDNLRNSVAHPKFLKFNGESEIESVNLINQHNGVEKFNIAISITDLKELSYELCEVFIEKIAKVEGT